jgi:mitotic spindle assembly checkpoint protein MAD2B
MDDRKGKEWSRLMSSVNHRDTNLTRLTFASDNLIIDNAVGSINIGKMAEDAPTFRTFVSTFTDFLTVAIHTILYERGIYPQTSFLSAKRYNFAVRQNRHPKVCEWINDAIVSVDSELLKGAVDRVAVVIYNKQNKPLERFMFDVSRFPAVSASDVNVALEAADGSVLPIVDLEEQLRATMSRLSNCSSTLTPLPKGCTFTIAIELKGEGNAPLSHPQPWMPAQAGRNGPGARQAHLTTPVRAVSAGEMVFETWIEEFGGKNSEESVSNPSSAG